MTTPAIVVFDDMPSAVDDGEQVAQPSGPLNSTGPGGSTGNFRGWRVDKQQEFTVNSYTRGILQQTNTYLTRRAVGDTAWLYGYITTDGGANAASDEGVTYLTVEGGETKDWFAGSIVHGGQGCTQPVIHSTGGSPSPSDGAFLLNISKGTLAGNLNGPSKPLPGTFLNQLPVTGVKLPLTTAWGWAGNMDFFNPVVPGQLVRVNKVPVTLTVTLGAIGGVAKPFLAGKIVSVAGSNQPEQALITAVGPVVNGTQAVTLNLSNPNESVVLFQDGIACNYLSFDAQIKLTGMMTSYYAFGSLTGTDLIYGHNVKGSLANNLLPNEGTEAASCSGPNSGFHLYPGAEVICNPVAAGTSPVIDPNTTNWEVGDQVVNPHFPTFVCDLIWSGAYIATPTIPGTAATYLELNYDGGGISRAFKPVGVNNFNPFSWYRANGGPLDPPDAYHSSGPHGNLHRHMHAPSPGYAVHQVDNLSAPGKFDLFNFNDVPNGHISFDPATAITAFQGVSVRTLDIRRQDNEVSPAASGPTHTIDITVNGRTYALCLIAKY